MAISKFRATAARPSRPCQTRGALRTDFTPARAIKVGIHPAATTLLEYVEQILPFMLPMRQR